MAHITFYKRTHCPYCTMAIELLKNKNVDVDKIESINIDDSMDLVKEMLEKADGRRTVPQIFIDGKHIGGYDDLSELDEKGELDKLLNN